MPHLSLNTRFIGRVAELWRIHETLHQTKTMVLEGVGVVSGMAGVGKTQLAVEYAHRFGNHYPGGLFWIDSEQGLAAMIERICRGGGLETDATLNETERLGQLWRALLSFQAILIILDNFPEEEELRQWLPVTGPIHILVTTRRRDLDIPGSLALNVMNTPEGIALLNSGERSFGPEAASLVETLGGHPLALELARNFLNLRTKLSVADLLTEMEKMGDIATLEIFAKKYHQELPTGHEKAITKTFKISWEIASDFGQSLLLAISLLAPAPVPRRILKDILDLEAETKLKVHPFAVMDGTLKDYLNTSTDEAIEIIEKLIIEVKKVNGCFISLWHNESLSNQGKWKDWLEVYKHLLKKAI